jgi:hypothetical protein
MSSKVQKYIGMVREYCIAISSAVNIFIAISATMYCNIFGQQYILIAISATINILYCNISSQQYIYCNILSQQYIELQYLRQSIYCIAILSNHNILYCEQYIAIYCQYNIFLRNPAEDTITSNYQSREHLYVRVAEEAYGKESQ